MNSQVFDEELFQADDCCADLVPRSLLGYCLVNISTLSWHFNIFGAALLEFLPAGKRGINFKLLVCLFVYCFCIVSF